MSQHQKIIEELNVTGAKLLETIKDLVRRGNVRRVSIRSPSGATLLEIPLVIGLAGALWAPIWAAVGALAALVAKCTLVVERVEPDASEAPKPAAKAKTKAARKPRKRRPTAG